MENQEIQQHRENYKKEEAYLRAEKRLKEEKGFYWHAFWYVVVNVFLIVMIGVNTNNFWNFGTFSTPIFWGIGLVFHALCVFGKNLFFSNSWEERKLREYMEKEKHQRGKYN
ncbi:2TM domain-containing protein [Tamlana fucoidanivorans]|uniref:2TM domain-containing protein n=1 Tax=Allotamlana fucoidanivorans TaxID=2583814 RepID=A0A5C4SJA0_9FLAO|nr:2TM domain-containing protein [Tamlana fucoidanivorans]TNJ43535.1 2TM domain-containing protein [Tamlana fucoidanivorans]